MRSSAERGPSILILVRGPVHTLLSSIPDHSGKTSSLSLLSVMLVVVFLQSLYLWTVNFTRAFQIFLNLPLVKQWLECVGVGCLPSPSLVRLQLNGLSREHTLLRRVLLLAISK